MEIDDLKKITNSLTVLCSEKQKQEKVKELVVWEMCITQTPGCRHGIFTKVSEEKSRVHQYHLYWNRTGVCHYHPFVYRYVHVFLN